MTPRAFIAECGPGSPKRLDTTATAACGWADYTPRMSDPESLQRLLALNRARGS